MKIIEENPYRFLGVYSNSPMRERVTNQGKIKAFLKVGKPVSFPLDLTCLLPPIVRTEQSMADANAQLTLPNDQIKFAQFWWMKITPFDEIAFNHLMSGDIDMAQSIWAKKKDMSSLQNRVVVALIQQKWEDAVNLATDLYSQYGSTFSAAILGNTSSADSTTLGHTFIDNLLENGIDASTLLTLTSNEEWKGYLKDKSINPLIDKINTAIASAKATRGQGPDARLLAGQKLMESTKNDLAQLRKLLTTNAIRYQTLADKLGIEILQCGIDYYNNTKDDDCARKAYEIQKYASTIVVGSLAKDRCNENVKILEEIIAELPPEEVMPLYHAIIGELLKFQQSPQKIANATTLLKTSKPYLMKMKGVIGSSNKAYIDLSTRVVNNALQALIAEINSYQNTPLVYQTNGFKGVLQDAWEMIFHMDSFDMDSSFKSYYIGNKIILKNMCDRAGISTSNHNLNASSTPKSDEKDNKLSRIGCFILIIIIFLFMIYNLIMGLFFPSIDRF